MIVVMIFARYGNNMQIFQNCSRLSVWWPMSICSWPYLSILQVST